VPGPEEPAAPSRGRHRASRVIEGCDGPSAFQGTHAWGTTGPWRPPHRPLSSRAGTGGSGGGGPGRGGGDGGSPAAPAGPAGLDMSAVWTDEQKAEARAMDALVAEAFRDGRRPSWARIGMDWVGWAAAALLALWLGAAYVPSEIPTRKAFKSKWTRRTVDLAVRELHYHPEVARRLGRPLVPGPVPVLVPRYGAVVPTTTVPLGQYVDADGRRHHQTEFELRGPLGAARVWADVAYGLEAPGRQFLFPSFHFLFVEFEDGPLHVHSPPRTGGQGPGAWKREWWQL